MDAAPCVPLSADPTAGATVCPKAGGAATAANVTNKRISRRCAFMPISLSRAGLIRAIVSILYRKRERHTN
jgi:hypothetical protein